MQPDSVVESFEAQRPRLQRLAYRMLGSVAAAEDVVQDAWFRWQQAADKVEIPAAFLSRIVTRLCLDELKSARARRETYVGAWLPEPLVGSTEQEEIGDNLTLTLMLALERLSPLERAAFLLHDVFETPLNEVATVLERDAGAVRQLAVRARKHIVAAKPRYPVEKDEADRIAQAFLAASRDGDTVALSALLAEDVVLTSDGGGKVLTALNPIRGQQRVVRLLDGIRRKVNGMQLAQRDPIWIDGLPGFVSILGGFVIQTTALEIEDGRITRVYMTRNPEKLRHVASLLGLETLSVPADGRPRLIRGVGNAAPPH